MPLAPFSRSFRFVPYRHWPWLAGVAVLLFSFAFGLSQFSSMHTQNAELGRKIRALNEKIRTPGTNADQSFNLRSHLADRGRLAIVTNDLQDAATQNGLTLTNATYQPQDAYGMTDIGKMDIGVNLKGTYPALKKMLAALLNAHDGLALDSISIQRAKSTDASMDIEAHFSFYYRKPA